LTGPEAKNYFWDVLEAWPNVDWKEHPYWNIFYDETEPAGLDTVEEVYARCFSG
jgi:hypothetical protein